MKIAILGTGISGLSLANLLNNDHEIHLFEKKKHSGGLIHCERIKNCLFHKVGGHVFNTKNERVAEWFWSNFDKDTEFLLAKRNAKILIENKLIGYPLENYLYQLDKKLSSKIIKELINSNLNTKIAANNFEEFLVQNFGETLFEFYFKPYNEKIWRVNLNEIDLDWLEGKLPMPNLFEIILNNIHKESEDNMVHSYFYYPKNNGSQFIVDRLAKNLNINYNFNPINLKITKDKCSISFSEFDAIVYTGDIRNLPESIDVILEKSGINLKQLKSLRSNGTSNLFCETNETDLSWLYIPESFTRAHRIIYTGNFSPTNNAGSLRTTCVIEFSGKVSLSEMIKEAELLPGNLTPISHNYEPNSYVIQDKNTRKLIGDVKKILSNYNIYLLGRFSEWEYYNMDKAIESAMLLADKLNDIKK